MKLPDTTHLLALVGAFVIFACWYITTTPKRPK